MVQLNESRVLIVFGRFVGTLTEARLWRVNPQRGDRRGAAEAVAGLERREGP